MVRAASKVILGALLLATPALADQYDFHVAQLGNPVSSMHGDANFRYFARQIGAAITSVNLSPPETLGHSGFSVTAELSMVYFGTGDASLPSLPTEGAFNKPMLIPSFHVRKGLPWSLEIGARGAWIEKSRMGYGTLELKWALNEGFTYLPDIGVRGHVSKLINSRDFDVTAGGLDLGIGKQFAIGGMITLTPYAGWNLVFVGASSGTVDFQPNRPLTQADSPGDQYNNYWVFTSVFAGSNSHNRFYGGLRFIGGVVQLVVEGSYSLIGKFHDAGPANEDRNVPPVVTLNMTMGLDF